MSTLRRRSPPSLLSGPKFMDIFPAFGLPVADADQDDVPFVPLHVLQVLDEEGFLGVAREERFVGWVQSAQNLELILDPAGLG